MIETVFVLRRGLAYVEVSDGDREVFRWRIVCIFYLATNPKPGTQSPETAIVLGLITLAKKVKHPLEFLRVF